MEIGSEEFDEYEQLGIGEFEHTCFVLIAGGLGERLGYNGIKIDLPVVTIEDNFSYLKYYLEYADAMRERALRHNPKLDRRRFYIPFCIMVSNDTHDKTI